MMSEPQPICLATKNYLNLSAHKADGSATKHTYFMNYSLKLKPSETKTNG
jgi:hypothetical protein